MNDYEHNLGDEEAIKAYRKDQAERAKAERQQGKEVDAKEEAYRKKHNIGPEVKGYQHMIAAEAEEKALRQKANEVKQGSLFGDDTQNNPNKAEMDRRAAKNKEDKAAAREAKKAEKATTGDTSKQASMISPKGNTTAAGRGAAYTGGGGGGGAGIPKVGPRKPTDMKKGGKVSSASKRADGCAIKGKTRGRMV